MFSLFITEFGHNYLVYFVDQMVESLSASGSIASFTAAHIIKSIAMFFVLLLEFIIAWLIIVKGVTAVTNFFEITTNDISDMIADGVANVVQNKTIK
jgi:hypothetical protein